MRKDFGGQAALSGVIPATGLVLAMLLSAACDRKEVTVHAPKTYHAYGSTWIYRQTEIRTSNPLLAPLHAGGNGYREKHSVEKETGERMAVEDRLYALQMNGRYKKIRCCEYFREQGELYNFENRLVLQFQNGREFITDCFIYPPGNPNNERKPKEQQIFASTVYAVYDPKRSVFLINEFDAGNRDSNEPSASEAEQSIEANALAVYKLRAPFMCARP